MWSILIHIDLRYIQTKKFGAPCQIHAVAAEAERWARRHIEDITDVNRIRFRVRLWSVFFLLFFRLQPISVPLTLHLSHSPTFISFILHSASSVRCHRGFFSIHFYFLREFVCFVSAHFFIHRRRCSCCLLPVRMYGRTCRHTFSWTIEARAHKKSKRAERACGIMSSAKNIMTARDAMVV